MCGAVYLKIGGGKKVRESDNNGERFRTKRDILPDGFHACKIVKQRLEVKPGYPGVHTPTLKLANSSFFGKES